MCFEYFILINISCIGKIINFKIYIHIYIYIYIYLCTGAAANSLLIPLDYFMYTNLGQGHQLSDGPGKYIMYSMLMYDARHVFKSSENCL